MQTEAFGQGRVKNLNHIWLRVLESSGIFAGPTADKLVEAFGEETVYNLIKKHKDTGEID